MTRKLLPLFCVVMLARAAFAQSELGPEDILGHDVELTLQQAIALALENNLNLQIIRNDPAVAREQIREAKGAYDPNLSGSFLLDHVETPVANSLQALFGNNTFRTVDDSKNYGAGLAGVLPYGPSYSSGYTFSQLNSTNALFGLKPQYTAAWTNSITLPLLRDLYWSTPTYQVERSKLQSQISDATFNSQLQDGVALVEGAYWALSASRALERSTQKGVDTAKDLLDQTQVQYQVGTVSKVLVTQAEAGVAQRESEHISALNNARRAQDTLLTAILAPQIGDYSTTTIRTEEPTFVDYPVDVNAAVEKARANRPELLAAEKQVEEADVSQKWSWNQKLPALDVGASYTMNGLSGTQKIPVGTPIGFQDDPTTPNTFDPKQVFEPSFGFGTSPGAAHSNFFAGDGFHNWTFGATFSYPLGNDTADSRYVQSKIELRRAKTSLAREEQDVVLSVRTAVRELQSSIDAVKAAQRARIASEETLRAEEERLRLGDSTPHNVLLFQNDLLTAESNEITQLQLYRTAISALERAQGTLLESRGISVESERERGMDKF
ncbi:MAG TPA: TolC family protein [Myxococcota bacterium]|nr:TolC family protein [Myxococcota bacterium]